MLTITKKEELIEFFNGFKTPGKAVIVSKTAVKMNKKDVLSKTIPNPFAELFKVQTMECLVNIDYQELVNDIRSFEDKSTDFKAEKRTWGEHVNASIIEHNGEYYLQCIPEKKYAYSYERADGSKIEYSEFDAFVPKPKEAFKDVSRQETEVRVDIRTFKLSSIIALVIEDTIRYVSL